jgi:SAM-dependent methyltransferase
LSGRPWTVAFEDWDQGENEFDLVMSAQAFHWIAPEVRYVKTARALKEDGHLALFWNVNFDPEGEIARNLDRVYRCHAPDMATGTNSVQNLVGQTVAEIVDSGYFGDVQVKEFPWSARYDTEQYLGLMSTYSDHVRLSPQSKRGLFDGVAQAINAHGGYVKPYVTILYVAPKTGQFIAR